MTEQHIFKSDLRIMSINMILKKFQLIHRLWLIFKFKRLISESTSVGLSTIDCSDRDQEEKLFLSIINYIIH